MQELSCEKLNEKLEENKSLKKKLSDHGDRSGGLLIGYVGLITVPVA